jgi:outer membrane protein TolC
VAEANAQIGVANAAWYPVFDLGMLTGLETGSPGSLFQAASAIWALGPGLVSQTLYDGGLRQAQSDSAVAAYHQVVADYRQTVLSAWREVEDQLAATRQLDQESATQAKAVTALTQALTQSQIRYQQGVVTYLDVVVNQNALLAGQLSQADIHLRQLTADVLLIKGLGGGWQVDEISDAHPAPTKGKDS